MATPDGQTLGTKEAALFRQVVKFYEGKQYKKGIKAADQVRRLTVVERKPRASRNHDSTGTKFRDALGTIHNPPPPPPPPRA